MSKLTKEQMLEGGKRIATEQTILSLLPEMTAEKLFWLRVECGDYYIEMRYGKKQVKEMRKETIFWCYFARLWEKIDRELIKKMVDRKDDEPRLVDEDYYRSYMKMKLGKYKINPFTEKQMQNIVLTK